MTPPFFNRTGEQKGAVLVLAAILLIVMLGFAALAVDIGHMTVVKNELQNAADAGALAGAAQLYFREDVYPMPVDPNDIGKVNPGANAAAELAAEKNSSVKVAVEVTLTGAGNNGTDSDVQRGHWRFSNRTFYPLDTLEPIDIGSYTEEDLDTFDGQDGRPAWINAVKVKTHRASTQSPAFFSQIFGYSGFNQEAEAVAYLGYAGTFMPGDFDWPIAICEESILNSAGNYECNQGRLINSASNDTANTGGWTNYSAGCTDSVSANDLQDLFYYKNATNQDCNGENPNIIDGTISVGGGQVNVAFADMQNCGGFNPKLGPVRDQPWELTLAVVDCDGTPGSGTMTGGQVAGCYKVTGAVTLEVVQITDTFPQNVANRYDNLPPKMADWTYDKLISGEANWRAFVTTFHLQVNGRPATEAADLGYYQNTIYAKPSCKKQPPIGKTGGVNTGVMAAIPVLVKGSINY